MIYRIEYRPRARKDLRKLPDQTARRIARKIRGMQESLAGDVKQLVGSESEFRLRVGEYRVLFEVDQDRILIRRVRHRREAYDR